MGTVRKIGTNADFAEGTGRCVEVDGKEIAVFRRDGTLHAIDNVCPHAGGPLAEGTIEGDGVTCPWHAWTFCFTTGANNRNARLSVQVYPVTVEGDEVLLEL